MMVCLVALGLGATLAVAQVAPPPAPPPAPGSTPPKPETPTPPVPGSTPPKPGAPTPAIATPPAPPVPAPPPGTPGPAAPAAPAKKPPAPVDEILRTSDRVELVVTYYGSTKGKAAVPVILLHGFHPGNRKDYKDLALFLQGQGYAVLAPDLRGHGASTKMTEGGSITPNNANYEAMVTHDLESIKAYLVGKNNDGELNIENLCAVGAEMGAAVATLWAARDWSWPVLTTGKQGQDVKALVLLSPKLIHKTLRMSQAMGSPAVQKSLSILIVVGNGTNTVLRDATALNNMWAKHHLEPPKERILQDKDLFFQPLQTQLQGTKLLTVKNLKVDKLIDEFIQARIVSKAYPWKNRPKPQ